VRTAPTFDAIVRVAIIVPLAVLMPLVETFGYTGANYCFDNVTGKWFLNVFIYGAWHFSGLLFYTGFDETPGVRMPWRTYVVRGFATVALILLLTRLLTDYFAPHFTEVHRGARYLNDWSADNCLGPKPNR
jgi:hypothetical protein